MSTQVVQEAVARVETRTLIGVVVSPCVIAPATPWPCFGYGFQAMRLRRFA